MVGKRRMEKKEDKTKMVKHIVGNQKAHTFSLFRYLSQFFTIFSHFSTRLSSCCFCWGEMNKCFSACVNMENLDQ